MNYINYKLASNTISKKEFFLLSEWIKKNEQFTMGNLTKKFEIEFSKFIKIKNSTFVNSGSSANLLIAQSLLESGYLKNKIIIAPALSWVTTITPFMQLGYNVKLCDCNLHNLGIDLEHFEKLCREFKPSCVILVHVLGHSNDMLEVIRICKKYKVIIIEDTCEALGSKINNKLLGTFGLASSYSFYYGHHISTIEGGMASTEDSKLKKIMHSVRSHGWIRGYKKNDKKKLEKKFKINEFQSLFTFYYSGFNLRPTEINAFLGLQQLKKINNISLIRQNNFKLYKKNLSNFYKVNCKTSLLSNFGYATLIKNRIETYNYLKKNGIETRPIISGNMGAQPFWLKKNEKIKLKNAEIIDKCGIYLPNHCELTSDSIDYIAHTFKKIAIPLLKI
jgi:CDP-6-deoxy-D-xylo-4-hexulose-3-dehydrase